MERELYRDRFQQRQTGTLSELIAFDSNDRAVWPVQQLRRALHDHLRSSLTAVVLDRDLVNSLSSATGPSVATFRELLHHAQPPLDLLYLVKDYAKLIREDPRSHVPPDVAILLYYGCIAVALLRHGRRISSLSDDDLRCGFNWAVRQNWIDDPTRCLFLDALTSLRSSLLRWRV